MFLPLRDDAPRARFPVVTLGLVAINTAVFVFSRLVSDHAAATMFYGGGAIPYEITHLTDLIDGAGGIQCRDMVPPPLTIVTSLFLHGGPEHLFGNVWFLWIFGRGVESRLGHARFALFFVVMGCLAAMAQVLMTPESRVPIVGASGAIAGVLGAYLVIYPRARVEALLFLVLVVDIVIVPSFVLLGVWVLWQLLANVGDGSVAVWAHVWGFLGGAILGRLFALRRRMPTFRRRATRPWAISSVRPLANASSSSLP